MKAYAETGSGKRPIWRLIGDPDLVPVACEIGAGDVESQSSTHRCLVAHEGLKDSREQGCMNAGAGITDCQDIILSIEDDPAFFVLTKPVDPIVDEIDKDRQDDRGHLHDLQGAGKRR